VETSKFITHAEAALVASKCAFLKEALDVRQRRVPSRKCNLNDDVVIYGLIEKISIIERERCTRRQREIQRRQNRGLAGIALSDDAT
jgi:hypothetical protein